jgi:hypothetical protein
LKEVALELGKRLEKNRRFTADYFFPTRGKKQEGWIMLYCCKYVYTLCQISDIYSMNILACFSGSLHSLFGAE